MLRLPALAALAFVAIVAGALSGSTLGPADVVHALLHPHDSGDAATIVWQLRLPRICVAATVGALLAMAGALLQSMLRNPLVDPYLTGVSAGAGAAIAIAFLLGISMVAAPMVGFAAGLTTALVVAAAARRGSGLDVTRLILAGVSLSAFFSAVISLAIARANSVDAATQIIGWLAGSLSGRDWHDVLAIAPYALVGGVLSVVAMPALNAMRAGDVRAKAVGVHVERTQWLVLAASSLFAACAVALAGIIGFVGLIVPHLARRVVGSDLRLAFPASALLGIALTVAADALARTVVAPAELPVGILLAFAGVPAFLYLYLRGVRTT